MNLRTGAFIALATLLVGGSAWAHHNMSALYDFNDRVTFSGTLTKMDWRNPHIELVVDTKKEAEQVKRGLARGAGPRLLPSPRHHQG